jgi:hypothetical protein
MMNTYAQILASKTTLITYCAAIDITHKPRDLVVALYITTCRGPYSQGYTYWVCTTIDACHANMTL